MSLLEQSGYLWDSLWLVKRDADILHDTLYTSNWLMVWCAVIDLVLSRKLSFMECLCNSCIELSRLCMILPKVAEMGSATENVSDEQELVYSFIALREYVRVIV